MSCRSRLLSILAVLLAILVLPAIGRVADPKSRPAAWATKIERPGLPNLHKVNDGLYRGAQPTAKGIKELERMGVQTIVCLRSEHSDKDILGGDNLTLLNIPMNTWRMKEEDVVRFLKIVTDKSRQPVFVHCMHGADRTGTMCAAYRVAIDSWTKQQAIDEMTDGGFGFHSVWVNLPRFVERLDVDKIRAEVVRPSR